ncbi:hypothetical protein GCM10008995_19960 [Halobellus salinus]|uniref:Uncharacterized protein n=1 Tax=Halobellus salinus TaxID=931585 RepID=A0A830EBW6_9EURY|nr:hypothetical protein GCM10008995_19960 [Halobellus salinus]
MRSGSPGEAERHEDDRKRDDDASVEGPNTHTDPFVPGGERDTDTPEEPAHGRVRIQGQ